MNLVNKQNARYACSKVVTQSKVKKQEAEEEKGKEVYIKNPNPPKNLKAPNQNDEHEAMIALYPLLEV